MIMEKKAFIFDIHRGTTHDGPGLRTTVFFKGCPLKCKWCHNPESIHFENEICISRKKCIACGTCNAVSGNRVMRVMNNQITINRAAVTPDCVAHCPTQALSFAAKEYTVGALYKESIKDKAFFETFSGGVTASGGEPTIHNEFLLDFFLLLQRDGIHTALDTCGYQKKEVFEALIPVTSAVLYDIKLMDDGKHQSYTGVSNEIILSNIKHIIHLKKTRHPQLTLWIRTPIIPFATDDAQNIKQIGRFISEVGEKEIDRWELCAFNNICKEKYEGLELKWEYSDQPLISENKRESILSIAKQYIGEKKVIMSGLTAK